MEADYEGTLGGRRFELFSTRRPFACPPVPPVSMASILVRRLCVEFGVAVLRGPRVNSNMLAVPLGFPTLLVSSSSGGVPLQQAAGVDQPRHLEHVVVYEFVEEHFGGYGRECEDPNEPRAGPLRRVVPTAVETPGSREPSHGSPIVWRPSLDVWRNSFGGRRNLE